MDLFYTAAYWAGFRPWELMATLPIRDQISALFDREEGGRKPPFGQALDLGCGTGIWAVTLAARGWQVTGVEIVRKALRLARKRASEADVAVRLIHGDIKALRAADVGSGFRFVLDLGAIHGLKDNERKAVGREVSAVAAAGATLLMLAWAPARRGPLARAAETSRPLSQAGPTSTSKPATWTARPTSSGRLTRASTVFAATDRAPDHSRDHGRLSRNALLCGTDGRPGLGQRRRLQHA